MHMIQKVEINGEVVEIEVDEAEIEIEEEEIEKENFSVESEIMGNHTQEEKAEETKMSLNFMDKENSTTSKKEKKSKETQEEKPKVNVKERLHAIAIWIQKYGTGIGIVICLLGLGWRLYDIIKEIGNPSSSMEIADSLVDFVYSAVSLTVCIIGYRLYWKEYVKKKREYSFSKHTIPLVFFAAVMMLPWKLALVVLVVGFICLAGTKFALYKDVENIKSEILIEYATGNAFCAMACLGIVAGGCSLFVGVPVMLFVGVVYVLYKVIWR